MRGITGLSVLIGLLLLLAAAPHVNAQALMTHQNSSNAIGVEVLKPSFANLEDVKFSTSTWFVGGTWNFSESWAATVEVPLATFGMDVSTAGLGTSSETETSLGNVYAGIRYGSPNQPWKMNFGLRLPTASEDKPFATLTGAYSDIERFDAFLPNNLGILATGQYDYRLESGVFLGAQGGGVFRINTDQQEGEDASEFDLLYAAYAGYNAPRFIFQGQLNGRYFATSEAEGFGAKSIHYLGFAADYKAGKVWPGLQIWIPLDEDSQNVVDFVAGLRFLVNLR